MATPNPASDFPAEETDKTVISSSTPVPLDPIPSGLNPVELGKLLVGQRLDDLWLEEFIGGGGMGAVFRAVDTRLNRHVAVKVLSTNYAHDPGAARRFQVEAQSAARLDHPNIARVHSVGEARNIPYIVFEYIDGTNLRDMVFRDGPLPLSESLDYTLQIADALLHAWQRNVVHRDIKPSNILVTLDRQAKLVDMGLARLHQVDSAELDLTASGMTIGTFDYISPEQARNPKDADTRSDIYSLGCTFYFMLTGQPPFSGGTALQKLLQHQGESPPALVEFRSDVPDSVAELVATMLAKRAEDRFQNPAELLTALVTVAEQLGISHSAIAIPSYLPSGDASESFVRRHWPWLVAVSLLVAGVVGLEALMNQQSEPEGFEPLPVGESAIGEPAIDEPAVDVHVPDEPTRAEATDAKTQSPISEIPEVAPPQPKIPDQSQSLPAESVPNLPSESSSSG